MSANEIRGGAKVASPQAGEIVIELASANNQDVMFNPLQKILRGRWDRYNLEPGASTQSKLFMLDRVPGLYISLDIAAKRARVFDPLALPENRELRKNVSRVYREVKGSFIDPVPEQIIENLNDSQIATWYYWMHRLCTSKKPVAELVRGSWLREAPAGRVKVDFHNTAHKPKRYKDEFESVA